MSPQYVTTERFEDHLKQSDLESKSFSDRFISIEKELGTKVSWLVFWSIFVLTIGVVATTFGVLYGAIAELQKVSNETQNNVSYIRGVLDKSEITR